MCVGEKGAEKGEGRVRRLGMGVGGWGGGGGGGGGGGDGIIGGRRYREKREKWREGAKKEGGTKKECWGESEDSGRVKTVEG